MDGIAPLAADGRRAAGMVGTGEPLLGCLAAAAAWTTAPGLGPRLLK